MSNKNLARILRPPLIYFRIFRMIFVFEIYQEFDL